MKISKQMLMLNTTFAKVIKALNGSEDYGYHAERYAGIFERHIAKYGSDVTFFSSPGRIEVCGNHTDHNNGKVLAAAITLDTVACVSPNDDRMIRIDSEGYPPVEMDIDKTERVPAEKYTSHALVRGILRKFAEKGYKTGGFDATTSSDVLKAAGVSSSASFELLIIEILNVLFNGGKIDKKDKAIIGQYAENEYYGKPSGLMDQSAIALGGVSYIDFEDTTAPVVKNTSFNFTDLSICVVDCGGDHSDLSDDYAAIRREMEAVAELFGSKKLRFTEEREVMANLRMVKEKVSGRAALRAIHFFDENRRVELALESLESNNEELFLSMVNESGFSSYTLLQNCHTISDTSQNICVALALAQRFNGVRAARVHGGGFAGTILVFIDKDKREAFADYMRKYFGEKNVYPLNIRAAGATKVEF